ncbi:hypothetical protein VA7868_02233 [Vibrio aerogenes CECT 7868]|uniref:Uncharacterized protein n=1 Tax=Vibrio aerogenes CECT 7868 TaxID=1216006 RepID=A0A1M5Z2Z2_9VIBR|nr:hypothetical protein VA7868_02233 [Vibrio aerogenes CECT 7868]
MTDKKASVHHELRLFINKCSLVTRLRSYVYLETMFTLKLCLPENYVYLEAMST